MITNNDLPINGDMWEPGLRASFIDCTEKHCETNYKQNVTLAGPNSTSCNTFCTSVARLNDCEGYYRGPIKVGMYVAHMIFKASNVIRWRYCYVAFRILFLFSFYFMSLSQFRHTLCKMLLFHFLHVAISRHCHWLKSTQQDLITPWRFCLATRWQHKLWLSCKV